MKHFLNLNKCITDQELFSHLTDSICSLDVYPRAWKAEIISEWKESIYFTGLGSQSLLCASTLRYSICSGNEDTAAAEGLCRPRCPLLLRLQCLTSGTKQDSVLYWDIFLENVFYPSYALAKSSSPVFNRGVVKCELRACDMQ